jgi:type I restriction enzyme S subunit
MSHVDEQSGLISERTVGQVAHLQAGYTYFAEGDVLFAKITPCMENGKCAIAAGLVNGIGFGSTEFHILRAGDQVLPEWVYYFLRQEHTRTRAARRMTGSAGQRRVPAAFLEETCIPLPPVEEQRHMAALLAKADRIRRLRRTAAELAGSYLESAFLEVFGDPTTNPMGWEVHKLGEHLTFVTSGGRGWAKYYSASGDRFIRSLDVQMNRIADGNAVYVTPPDNAEAQRTRVQAGDVLLTITGSRIGRVSPVPASVGTAYVSQHVAILRLDREVRPEFVSMFMSLDQGGQRQIARLQYGQTKPGLGFDQIHSFKVPVPSLDHQDEFAFIVREFERLRSQQREAERQAEQLFQSLLHRAFRGEL